MILNQERLPVIIGKNGETKKLIEKLTQTRIEIDSKTGEVIVSPIDEKQLVEPSGVEPSNKTLIEEELLKKAAAEVKAESRESEHATEELHTNQGDTDSVLPQEDEASYSVDGEEFSQLENLGSLNVWIAENIIRAINRGFNPQKALRLLNEEYMLEIIDLEPILGRSEKAITRVKGRIIGEGGSMRGAIEQFANCYISVFGNTVSVIGQSDDTRVARKALQMLIQGVPHKNVYSFLEKKYKEKKDENIKKLWRPTF